MHNNHNLKYWNTLSQSLLKLIYLMQVNFVFIIYLLTFFCSLKIAIHHSSNYRAIIIITKLLSSTSNTQTHTPRHTAAVTMIICVSYWRYINLPCALLIADFLLSFVYATIKKNEKLLLTYSHNDFHKFYIRNIHGILCIYLYTHSCKKIGRS